MPAPTPKPPVWNVVTVAGAEAGFANGAGATARFKSVTAIVASKVTPNRFYLADSAGHLIRTMDVGTDGALTIGTHAGTGVAGSLDGPSAAATFNRPFGLAVDTDDTLYVSESGGHRIRKIAPDGTVSTFAGSGAAMSQDGKGLAASFGAPAGIALAADKTLYVADFGTHLLRKVVPDGTVTTLAGGPGLSGYVDATGSAARFNRPAALAVDPASGHLIVADQYNFRVRQVTAAGVVTTIGGSANAARFFWDGPALDIAIGYPRALTFDSAGKLFVGSTNVRMRRDDGRLTSYAGLHLTGHTDAEHSLAYFSNIQGLAFGPKGVLYVADGTRVRAIVPPSPAP
ncbi:Virginiamycin B lyase [compost metagenome]